MSVDVGERSGEILLDRAELDGEFVALPRDLVQLRLDPCRGKLTVGGEVDQVLFLDRELAQLGFELLAKQLLCPGLVGDGFLETFPHGGDELAAELDGLIVRLDSSFDPLHVGVRRVADVILHPAAEEVRVLAAVTSGRPHDDHALDDAVLQAAASAPDGPLEVVVVLDAALAGLVAGIEQRLNFLEQLRIDQGLVASVVDLAFVFDLAEVVAVAEQPLNL